MLICRNRLSNLLGTPLIAVSALLSPLVWADQVPKQHPIQGSGPGLLRWVNPAPPPNPSTARTAPVHTPAPAPAPTPAPAAPAPAPMPAPAAVVAAPPPAVAPPSVAPIAQPTAAAVSPGDPSTATRSGALAYGGVGEVRPSRQALTASLRGPDPVPAAVGTSAELQSRLDALAPAAACVPVVLTAVANRPGTTWVDLTGDGLIISAVDSAHVAAVLARTGQPAPAAAGAAAHCLPQASIKDMLRSAQRPGSTAASMKLVKLAHGWQLVAPTPAPAARPTGRTLAAPKQQARRAGRMVAKG